MTRTLLSIAGSDPSGAAGVQVDLQVFRDFGFHGLSVLTAVIAQNTQGVSRLDPVAPDLLAAQLGSIRDDFVPSAIKVGLVATADQVETIVEFIQSMPDVPVVWDPVMASGDGATEMTERGTSAALREATAFVDVVTPNVSEAEVLLATRIETREAAYAAARTLVDDYDAVAVLLKAGHLAGESGALRDVWADVSGVTDLNPLPRIDADVRGTGCQLSSAIAAGLADAVEPREAVEAARSYLAALLTRRQNLGRGRPIVVR